MQDPRLRLGATVLVSLAAFMSLGGAAAAALWWLCCTSGLRSLPRTPAFAGTIAIVVFMGVISAATGAEGLSYTIRMIVILCIAAWAYHEHRPGDLLDTCVWMFGERFGFDLGLLGEMGLQTIEVIRSDARQIRMALSVKGTPAGIGSIVPVGANLLLMQLNRSGRQARLLAVRGYTGGGKICPGFQADARDAVTFVLACAVAVFALFSLRAIFILIQ